MHKRLLNKIAAILRKDHTVTSSLAVSCSRSHVAVTSYICIYKPDIRVRTYICVSLYLGREKGTHTKTEAGRQILGGTKTA